MSLMLNRSHSGSRGGEQFPDPFMDMASLYMPETIPDALKWCEFILMAQGIYWQALSRVAAYFITDVEIGGAARETKDKYKEFLEDQLGIKAIVQAVAMDYMVYGNSFTSVLMPFRRYLSCPQCGLEQPLRKIYNNSEFKFRWDFEFRANCPKCHYDGKWTHIDRRSGAADDIKVKRWNPHEMDLLWDPLTDSVDYIWKLSDDYRQLLRKGDVFHLEKASWEVVQAVKHNQVIMFDKDVVYHMKEEALAGIRNRGWGISRVLTNFRQAWYVQVLHRYNEAIALDYVIPFRVITPAPRTGTPYAEASDPIASMNLGNFTRYVTSMLRKRRRDPAAWNVLPFPVEYKALGGDATQLAPSELLELGIDTLLTSVGVPVEFYKGTLSLQSAPAALRLFEANWSHLCHNLNRFLAKLVKQVGILMSWEPVTAKLMRVTHADDLNRQMAKLQLMLNKQVSQTTGLRAVGSNFQEEQRQMLEDERFVAEETQKMQEEMESSQTMGQLAQGSPPGGGGGGAAGGGGGAAGQFAAGQPMQPNTPITPEDMQSKAQTLAQQLLALPESAKDSELIALKRSDPTMHALVKSLMEDMRRQARMAGGEAVMQQQFGKQAAAGSNSILGSTEPPLRFISFD